MDLNPTHIADLLRDPETHMTTLFVILHAAYGEDIYFEDPLVLFAQLEEDFNAELPIQAENRINAGLTTIPSDLFYRDPSVFQAVANTLYSGDLGDDIFLDDLTLPEIMWAIFEVDYIRDVMEAIFGDSIRIPDGTNDFTPLVEKIIADVAASESIEVDEAEALEPYAEQFIGELFDSLDSQLRKLGVDPDKINAKTQESPTP